MKALRTILGAAMVAIVLGWAVESAEAGSRKIGLRGYVAREQQIKQMHILDRPDRPGHFYGNTVRKLHRRGVINNWPSLRGGR